MNILFSINSILFIGATCLLLLAGWSYVKFTQKSLLKTKRKMDTVLIQGAMCLLLTVIAILVLFIIAESYWLIMSIGNKKLDIIRWMWFIIDFLFLFFFYKTIMLLKKLAEHIFIPINTKGN